MTEPVPVPHGLPMDRDVNPFDPPSPISRLRAAHPVSPLIFPDGHEGWLITGYDAVRQVLADTRFSSRQDLGVVHVPYETPGMPVPTEPMPGSTKTRPVRPPAGEPVSGPPAEATGRGADRDLPRRPGHRRMDTARDRPRQSAFRDGWFGL